MLESSVFLWANTKDSIAEEAVIIDFYFFWLFYTVSRDEIHQEPV